MWGFLVNLMPGGVWEWVGAALLAAFPLWIGYRLGRRTERNSEQRQILTDLLSAISAIRMEEQPNDEDLQDQASWWKRNREVHSRINDLLCRSRCEDLRTRLRTLDIISPLHWSTENSEVLAHLEGELEALGTPPGRIKAVVFDDAYQVVAAAVRGENLPRLDENPELTEIEEMFISYGGRHPNL